MTNLHRCAVDARSKGCSDFVCEHHYKMLPAAIRSRLWDHYNRGRTIPDIEDVEQAALAWIKARKPFRIF